MKANLVKPRRGLKTYKFDVEKMVARRQEKGEWNSFSTSPREGEKWIRYSHGSRRETL